MRTLEPGGVWQPSSLEFVTAAVSWKHSRLLSACHGPRPAATSPGTPAGLTQTCLLTQGHTYPFFTLRGCLTRSGGGQCSVSSWAEDPALVTTSSGSHGDPLDEQWPPLPGTCQKHQILSSAPDLLQQNLWEKPPRGSDTHHSLDALPGSPQHPRRKGRKRECGGRVPGVGVVSARVCPGEHAS